MSWMCGNGLTRENIPQTSLAIDSGATIHFFSNEDLSIGQGNQVSEDPLWWVNI